MRLRITALLLVIASVVFMLARPAAQRMPSASPPDDSITFRVTFGYLRAAPKSYDGSLAANGGQVRNIELWRGMQQDAVSGSSWKLQVRRMVFENQPDKPNPVAGGSAPVTNVVPAGLFVTVDRTTASVDFQTAQGNFSVPVQQLGYGRVPSFLDGDVLVERTPGSLRISASAEQHDYPSLAVTRSGAVWTAWQAYEERGDHVYARQPGGAAMRVTSEKADVYHTAITEDAAGRIQVVWSERTGEDWNLYERVWDGSNWAPRRQLTNAHSPNIFHKLAGGAAGPLRLVWVGFDGGQSYLYLSSFENGNWTAPQRIGGPSVWMPDAVADRQGNLYVAWDSYQNGNYDILYRRIAATGALDPIEQVTRSVRFQAHASLTVDAQGRPWLAWDESGANWGKDWNHEDVNRATVLYSDRSIKVVVKDGGAWKQAGDFSTAVDERLRRYWQLPRLAVDGTGRVWALFQIRTAAINNRDDYWCSGGLWDLYLTTYENGMWRPAALVPNSSGRNETAFQAVGAAAGIWMTWATDGRRFGRQQAGFQAPTMAHYEVYAAQASDSRPPGVAVLSAFEDPEGRSQIMHPGEKQDVARIRGYRTTVNGQTYRILRGDFHRHTEISNDGSGDGSVEDFYRYMMDVAEMDTGIVGDHNMGGDVEYSWWRTEKSYDVFHVRGRYTPLFGYERSVAYPNGHRNVVFDHRGIRTLPVRPEENKAAVNSGAVLYPYLRQNRGICMEHSLATGQGTDYRDNDPVLEPLVEIYQGYHASYEYKGAPRAEDDQRYLLIHGTYQPQGFWWNALAKGLKLGVQASSDHISTHCSYALIYSPDDNRANIVENMRRRHAYAATDNIVLDVQSEGHLMGDEFASPALPKFHIKVLGTDQIAQVDVIRNNEFIFTQKPMAREYDVEFQDKTPRPGESYYYVRVIQLDHNLAWSSPIWIRR
jgi:hypothetical protein